MSTTESSGNTSYSGKGIGTATAKATMNIRTGASTSYKSYGTIKKGTAVEVLEALSSGWYKIVWAGASCGYAYTSNANGAYYTYVTNSTSGGTSSSTKVDSAASYDKAIAGTYKTTAALNLRAGAGTSKTSLYVMPKGSTVKNYGYYTTVSNVKWYYVVYTNSSGKSYTGFCSSAYLTK